MDHRKIKVVLLITLAVACSGCGEGGGEYVNFDQTAPSPVDQRKATEESKADTPAEDQPAATSTAQAAQVIENAVASDLSSGGSRDVTSASASEDSAVSNTVQTVSANSVKADVPGAASSSERPSDVSQNIVVSAQSGLSGPAGTPLIDNIASPESRTIELLVPTKHFRKERGTTAVRVTYDDIDLLKVLNMDPVPSNAQDYFPDWLSALNGKKIRIRGFMYPEFVLSGLTRFTLARDNQICCFQKMPKVYDVIFVKLAEGETTDYIENRAFDVEGTLRFDTSTDEQELPRLYRIEDARVLGAH